MHTAPTVLLSWALVLQTFALAQCPALTDAAGKGDVKAVTDQLAAGSDSSCIDDSRVRGWTPLMAAARAGSAAVVQALLKAHVDVNATNEYGATALDIAVAGHGNSSQIAVLIRAAGGKGREPVVDHYADQLPTENSPPVQPRLELGLFEFTSPFLTSLANDPRLSDFSTLESF